MANIARGLKMMFKSKRFDPKKFYKKGSSSKRHEKNSKGTRTSYNKNESNLGPCFGCGLPGHVVKDCPILQKKDEKQKQKAKKEVKKANGSSTIEHANALQGFHPHHSIPPTLLPLTRGGRATPTPL